ncbi:hypothetical protein [Nodularia spumigena]|nr:hypothetical protein [Nodularia spumigena]MEA5555649.1 hypothetical protein [Nodularia spumigena CH309]
MNTIFDHVQTPVETFHVYTYIHTWFQQHQQTIDSLSAECS